MSSSSPSSSPPSAADKPAPSCSAGDVVGDKYRLERKAGEGGMGTVWVAVNTALETPVAIKVIHSGSDAFGGGERLLREARATALLRHPAVVRVFDFGRTDAGNAYIVMELLEGESLRDVLQREGRLAPERSVQLLLPICEGLVAAHARGIIHRDLKPDNIYLATDDTGRLQPKLVDFGVAKVIRGQTPGITGMSAVGTPEYMAPEQAYALDDIDQRADVWALCATLYELCTDEYLFTGDTYDQVLRKVVGEDAPSLEERAGVDPELAAIVQRGLCKQREERWPDARTLGGALARWLLSRGVEEDACGAALRATWLRESHPELGAVARAPAAPHMGDAKPTTPTPGRTEREPGPLADSATSTDSATKVAPPARPDCPTSAPTAARIPSVALRPRRAGALLGGALALVVATGWTLFHPDAGAPPGAAAAEAEAVSIVDPSSTTRAARADTTAAPTARGDAAVAVVPGRVPDPTDAADRVVTSREPVPQAPSAMPSSKPAPKPAPPKTKPEDVDFGF